MYFCGEREVGESGVRRWEFGIIPVQRSCKGGNGCLLQFSDPGFQLR